MDEAAPQAATGRALGEVTPCWGDTLRIRAGQSPGAGGYDQVARRERFIAGHPGAEAWHGMPLWYGALPLGQDGWRWSWTCGRVTLAQALDALEWLAARAAECAAWEEAHPGWTAWYSAGRPWRPQPWRAWRPGLRQPVKGASLKALAMTVAGQS